MGKVSTDRLRTAQVVAVVVLAALLHFIRFGYDFGASDQDELVPAALHALDNDILNADWFVRSQATTFNVRTPTVAALTIAGAAIGILPAVLLFYIIAFGLAATGIVRLVRQLSGSAVAAAVAPIVVLVLTPGFTVGGNDVTSSVFVPSMMAWGLVIHGIVATLQRKPLRAGLLFGVGVLFQPLVGLLVAGTTTTAVLLRKSARAWAIANLTTLIVGSPLLLAIARDQLTSAAAVPAATIFHILVEVRAPHHFLPAAFPAGAWIRFGALAAGGVACILAAPRLRQHRADLVAIFGIAFVACTCYVLAVESASMLTVAKMQLFKLTVLVKILSIAAICIVAAALVERIPGVRVERMLALIPGVALVGCLLVTAVVQFQPQLLERRVAMLARAEDPWSDLYRWAAIETDNNAVFAVPPSNSSFRTWARRAIVVNFKAFPFQDTGMVEWYRRIRDTSDHPALASGYVPAADLDIAYEQLGEVDLTRLAELYGFTYVARTTPLVGVPADSSSRWTLVYPPDEAADDAGPRVYAFVPRTIVIP